MLLYVVCWPLAKMDYSHPSDVQDSMEGSIGRSSTEGNHPSNNSPPYVTHHPLK